MKRKVISKFEADTCENCGRDFSFWLKKHCQRCLKVLCPECVVFYTEMKSKPGRPFQQYFTKMEVCALCYQLLRIEKAERDEKNEEERENELEDTVADIEENY